MCASTLTLAANMAAASAGTTMDGRMVCQCIGNPFVLHHINRALRRRVIPLSMPQSPRMISMRRRSPEVRAKELAFRMEERPIPKTSLTSIQHLSLLPSAAERLPCPPSDVNDSLPPANNHHSPTAVETTTTTTATTSNSTASATTSSIASNVVSTAVVSHCNSNSPDTTRPSSGESPNTEFGSLNNRAKFLPKPNNIPLLPSPTNNALLRNDQTLLSPEIRVNGSDVISGSDVNARENEAVGGKGEETVEDVTAAVSCVKGTEEREASAATAGQGKRGSRQSATSIESASSENSVTKQAKRFARKAPSMSPGAKWRRLRNTLKAAQEMQAHKKKQALSRDDSFLRKFSTRNQRLHNLSYTPNDDGGYPAGGSQFVAGVFPRSYNEPQSYKPPRNFAVQHDGNFMFNWLGVVTVAVLYNLWTCILRQAFREVQQACHACWFTFDVLSDLIYLLDILVQFRTGYLNQGLMVYDSKKLARRYIESRLLYVDSFCLLPLDFLQFYTGVHPMLRFPRFLKVYRTFRFIHMLESRTAYPNLIRVANLTHILFLGAHWFAAFYYMISEAEDFKGKWSYPMPEGEYAFVSRKYLACLFWSTLTLTTIGDLPPPDKGKDYGMSNAAYVFVIVSYLIGVFVFATIVGQVGNVINNKNASRQEFERLLDGAKVYMQTHNVPSDLQKRVQRWYDYVWSRGRLNGCDINSLGLLPDKLKTELAIHVNLETLKKVTIFQECQPEFLHDLVLKMKAYIFTPGDLICRRGEVAREMFIIADGVVEIISESGTVLKQMGAGDFFGEIGILNLDGGINRRTADVRSVGYSELFVLSREDVLGALKDHPDAESIIRDYGQRRLREIEAHRQLVKPLKQLGTASHRLLNMRNPTSGLNATPGANNPTSEPGVGGAGGGGGGGGTGASSTFAQARPGAGGKPHTYHYMKEDPESLSFANGDKSVFHSVWSNIRRIFHRKVPRRKDDEGEEEAGDSSRTRSKPERGRLAWMSDDHHRFPVSKNRMARLCCKNGSQDEGAKQEGYVPVPTTVSAREQIPKRLTRAFYNSPSGYTAVLTEEEETGCPSTPTSPAHPLGNSVSAVSKLINYDRAASSTGKDLSVKTSGHTVAAEVNVMDVGDADVGPPRSPSTSRLAEHPDVCSVDEQREACEPSDRSKGVSGALRDSGPGDRGDGGEGGMGDASRDFNTEVLEHQHGLLVKLPNTDRRCSEPMTYMRPRDRTLSGSFISSSDTVLRSTMCRLPSSMPDDFALGGLEVFHGDTRVPSPCIRIESASTEDSFSSEEQISLPDQPLDSSNLLHPDYRPQSSSKDCDDDDDDDDDDNDDIAFRYRSNSAPNIVVRSLPGPSVHLPLPYCDTARQSTAGSSVAVGSIAGPPTPRPVSLFQRRLNSWAQLDGCARPSAANSQTTLASSPRRTSWTPATDPLLHVPSCDVDPVLHNQSEYLTSLLVQLQYSHEQLHSRMSELEAAYLTNTERLERLGAAQADIMTILHSQSLQHVNHSRNTPRPGGMEKGQGPDEDMTAL